MHSTQSHMTRAAGCICAGSLATPWLAGRKPKAPHRRLQPLRLLAFLLACYGVDSHVASCFGHAWYIHYNALQDAELEVLILLIPAH